MITTRLKLFVDFVLIFLVGGLRQQSEPQSPDPEPPERTRQTVHSFCKILTASDTSTHGGFSVLRKHATECLPPLVNLSTIILFFLPFFLVWFLNGYFFY